MRLITTLIGVGSLQLGPVDFTEVGYTIEIWINAADVVFGKGRITGAVEIMFRTERVEVPLALTLAGGRVIKVTVTERGAGSDWASIYVPHPPVDLGNAA